MAEQNVPVGRGLGGRARLFLEAMQTPGQKITENKITEQNIPAGRGRGGRGRLILEALQTPSQQPGSQSSSETSSSIYGACSSDYTSSKQTSSQGLSDTSSKSSLGRGIKLSQFISEELKKKQKPQIQQSSEVISYSPLGRPIQGRGNLAPFKDSST